jgi:uncharacterized membrane protein required for colicin V production
MQEMSYVDAILMVVCLLFALGGFQKGFAGQIAQLTTFVCAMIGLFFFYPFLFSLARDSFTRVDDTYLMWVLLAVFLLVALIIYIGVTRLMAMAIKSQITESSDRALGMLLGMFRGIFIIVFVMMFSVMLGPVRCYEEVRGRSGIGRFVCDEMVPRVQPHMTRANFRAKLLRVRSGLRNTKEHGFFDR